jgi:hypothetical protein
MLSPIFTYFLHVAAVLCYAAVVLQCHSDVLLCYAAAGFQCHSDILLCYAVIAL